MSGLITATMEVLSEAAGIGFAVGIITGSLLSAAMWLIAFRGGVKH